MSDSDVREWSQVCGEERRVIVSVEASIHHDPPHVLLSADCDVVVIHSLLY